MRASAPAAAAKKGAAPAAAEKKKESDSKFMTKPVKYVPKVKRDKQGNKIYSTTASAQLRDPTPQNREWNMLIKRQFKKDQLKQKQQHDRDQWYKEVSVDMDEMGDVVEEEGELLFFSPPRRHRCFCCRCSCLTHYQGT